MSNINLNIKLSLTLSILKNLSNISITLKKEFFRKSIHIVSAFVPYFYFFYREFIMVGLLVLTIIYLITELLRVRNIYIPLITKITNLASRSRDEGKVVLGPITLAIGIFLSFTFFDYRSAVIAIFALSFGDGVASLFGKMIGGYKIPLTFGKTFSGTAGCFIVLIVVFTSCGLNFQQALITSGFASIIEAFPTGDFDNLLIPVFTGLFAQHFIL